MTLTKIIFAAAAALSLGACTATQNLPLHSLEKTLDLPPDPGAAGSQTIEGVDVNENGVRDEVERKLALSFAVMGHQAIYPKLLELQMTCAKAYQEVLISEDPVFAAVKVMAANQNLRVYVDGVNEEIASKMIDVPEISYLPSDQAAWIAVNIRRYVFDTEPRAELFAQRQKMLKTSLD